MAAPEVRRLHSGHMVKLEKFFKSRAMWVVAFVVVVLIVMSRIVGNVLSPLTGV